MDSIKLKEDYRLAKCCSPMRDDVISGYFGQDNIVKVHRRDCVKIAEAPEDRLLTLEWDEIIESDAGFSPGEDYSALDDVDFRILNHHLAYGVDYSLVVARKLRISRQAAFDHHRKLRDMGLLRRVQPKMIQYRKGVVDNKWIKHRNHTYYGLTGRGRKYIDYFLTNKHT